MLTKRQRRLFTLSTSTNLYGTIPFEMNDWRYAHPSPQSSGRDLTRPGNYTWLASV